MNKNSYTLTIILILMGSFFVLPHSLHAQRDVNVQVKVYNEDLKPMGNHSLQVDQTPEFSTNSSGLAFIKLPESSLPPNSIEVLDRKLEVESWNYSKGILEIIIRQKTYRQINITVIDVGSAPVAKTPVAVKALPNVDLKTDPNGKLSLRLPAGTNLSDKNLLEISEHTILQRRINEDDMVIVVNPILKQDLNVGTKDQPIAALPVEEEPISLDFTKLDSIQSLTVLYSLMKDVEYERLDEASRAWLDGKFNELMFANAEVSLQEQSARELITDSTVLEQDLLVAIDQIRMEEQLLNTAREDFELFTKQIEDKLVMGGQDLDFEERKQLIQLVLNLKDMLRRNEEKFYRNNEYYNEKLDGFLGQLANIHELEDMLTESEDSYSKIKAQLVYVFFGLGIFIGITMLLAFLVRALKNKREQLSKANEEISRINENLEGLVAEKTESLEMINYELDTFLYRSSHNLKRPLTSIRGLANIAEITLSDEAIDLFEKVVLTTQDMEKMLDKLSMMNHINQPANYGELKFKNLIGTLSAHFAAEIEQGQIKFKTKVEKDLAFNSFPTVIEIILHNLLENAMQFARFNSSNKPEVKLSFSLDPRKRLNIVVEDNGCGIAKDIQDKIWEMFFIGNDKSKGSGLGLFITKKAVEALKGEISMTSEVGKFTRVSIVLPRLQKSKRKPRVKKQLQRVTQS